MADLDVSPEALTTHAQQVESLMSAVRDAAAYGDQAFDLRAFGIIGSTWSSVMKMWCDDAKNLIDATADGGNQIAAAMRQMADSYTTHDASSAGEFSKIQGAMGPVAPGSGG